MKHTIEEDEQRQDYTLPSEIWNEIISTSYMDVHQRINAFSRVSKQFQKYVIYSTVLLDLPTVQRYGLWFEEKLFSSGTSMSLFEDFLSTLSNLKYIDFRCSGDNDGSQIHSFLAMKLSLSHCIRGKKMFSNLRILVISERCDFITGLPLLNQLVLHNCQVNARYLSKCNQLEQLALIDCYRVTPKIFNNKFSKTLKILHLECSNNYQLVPHILKCEILEKFSVSDTRIHSDFTDGLPFNESIYNYIPYSVSFEKLCHLKKVNLSDSRIILNNETFENLLALESLRIHCTTGDTIKTEDLSKLPNLTKLAVADYHAFEKPDIGLDVLDKLPKLKKLYFDYYDDNEVINEELELRDKSKWVYSSYFEMDDTGLEEPPHSRKILHFTRL